jgi:hypothetical protein
VARLRERQALAAKRVARAAQAAPQQRRRLLRRRRRGRSLLALTGCAAKTALCRALPCPTTLPRLHAALLPSATATATASSRFDAHLHPPSPPPSSPPPPSPPRPLAASTLRPAGVTSSMRPRPLHALPHGLCWCRARRLRICWPSLDRGHSSARRVRARLLRPAGPRASVQPAGARAHGDEVSCGPRAAHSI